MEITIGENIKRLRIQKGLSQAELAAYLGLTPSAVSRWESGMIYPSIWFVPEIAAFFGVSVDELLGVKLSEREARRRNIYSLISYGERFGYKQDPLNTLREAYAEFPDDMYIGLALSRSLVFNRLISGPNFSNVLQAKGIIQNILRRLNDTEFRTECENLNSFLCETYPDDVFC